MKRKNLRNIKPGRLLPAAIMPVLVLFASCSFDDGDDYSVLELGAVENEYILPAEAGEETVEVLANKTFTMEFLDDQTWLHPSVTTLGGDGTFDVAYDENEGFARMTRLFLGLSGEQKYDTIVFKQRGRIEPTMAFDESSMTVDGSTGHKVTAPITLNVPFSDIRMVLTFTSLDANDDWIDNVVYNESASAVEFNVLANPSPANLRSARMTFTYIDGWEQAITSTLYITQKTSLDQLGEEITFAELRDLAEYDMLTAITEDILITGYISNVRGGQNTAMNEQISGIDTDMTVNDKSAYIQDETGQYGFWIVTPAIEDNIFTRYSKVTIMLNGTSIMMESDPDRYSLYNVTADRVASAIDTGDPGVLPVKRKTIAELTDDDIYTYVTLYDLEIPIRKGPYVPINEGYADPYTNQQRVDAWPMVLRDRRGDDMFLMTNVRAPWRRDGNPMPQGSGEISGIIVHENYKRFEQDGNIGRYQIRAMTQEEIKLDPDFDNGFSSILAEWTTDWSAGAALIASNTGSADLSLAGGTNMNKHTDRSYLGPITTTADIGFDNKGFVGGYADSSIQTELTNYLNSLIPAVTSGSVMWDEEEDWGNSWVIRFSTAGLTTDVLSFQVCMHSNVGGPRYYALEWSAHGNDDGVWNHIQDFTVPDVVNWTNTHINHTAGLKNMTFNLPLAMLGQNNVYLRMRVTQNVAGTTSSYDGAKISNASMIGYMAIRYNKP